MNQYSQSNDLGQHGEPARAPSNPLAVVGLILAFCLSPIGLLLSLIALAWPPRVLAVVGVVVGLLGSALWVIFGAGAIMVWPLYVQASEVMQDYEQISRQVESHRASHNNELPADLSTAGVTGAVAVDPWGNAYTFEKSADGGTWSIRSLGPDGQSGTADDLTLPSGMSDSDKANTLSKMIERLTQQRFGAPPPSRP